MTTSLSHSEIESIRAANLDPDIPMYRRYARGDQDVATTIHQRQAMAGKRVRRTADNVVHLLLATIASRLRFTGWTVDPIDDGGGAEDQAASDAAIARAATVDAYLADLFLRNQMARKQFDTHYAQLRDGNHAVVLRWKPSDRPGDDAIGRVTIHRERWWDGVSGMFVGTDESDEPLWAVKDWTETNPNGKQIERRIIYYDDRFERYVRDGSGWTPYAIEGDAGVQIRTGVVPWLRPNGRPLGLPVVYFPNGTDDDSSYGRSDLVGMLGLQDDLNAAQSDIRAASAYTGYQMTYVTGYKAADGAEPVRIGPGRFLEFSSADVNVGTIPAGSIDSLRGGHEYKRSTMAVDLQVPIHSISGQWPSGDALTRADMPLVDRAVRLGEVDGPSWTMVGHRATEIANAFGGLALDEDSPIRSVFDPPDRLDALTEAEIATKRVAVYNALSLITDPILFRRAAVDAKLLTDAEVDAVLDDRETRAAAVERQMLGGGSTAEDGADDDDEPPDGEFPPDDDETA